MPYNFSGLSQSFEAKLQVVRDGDTYTGAPTVLASGSTATLTLSSTTVTLTGGSGFTSGMNDQYIYISGAATSGNNGWFQLTYISATSVSWTNASGATDANNGHISYAVAALGVTTQVLAPSARTVFAAPPARSATGVWSVSTKDPVQRVCEVHIVPVLPSGVGPIYVQQRPDTTTSSGNLTLNWVFTTDSGTPTDLPFPGSFRVYLAYSETKDGV